MTDIIAVAILLTIILALRAKASDLTMNDVEAKIIRDYGNMIIDEGNSQGVDPAVIAAIIEVESGGNQSALRHEKRADGTVWDSSYGLMQILSGTAKWIALQNWGAYFSGNVNDLYSPGVNIPLGASYLGYQYRRYGNVADAVAAYNAGSCYKDGISCLENRTGKYTNSQGVPNVQDYVDKVMKYTGKFRVYFKEFSGKYKQI